jgi:hypothetical protein
MFNGWLFVVIHHFYENENWAHLQQFVLDFFIHLCLILIHFKEPNNLKNRNSFRLNGLVHPKVVGVEAVADGKGVVFSTGSLKSMIIIFSSF